MSMNKRSNMVSEVMSLVLTRLLSPSGGITVPNPFLFAYSRGNLRLFSGLAACLLMPFLAIAVLPESSVAQDTGMRTDTSARTVRFGGFAGAAYNIHQANFPALPNIPTGRTGDGVAFGDAAAFGLAAGALVEYPLSDMVNIGLRLSYVSHAATLNAVENSRLGALSSDGTQVEFYNARLGRELQANIASLGVEPLLGIHPFAQTDAKGLRFYAGARIGYMFQRTYSQRESILSLDPENSAAAAVAFNNLLRERNPQSGDIPQSQLLHIAASVGIGYDISLGALAISPEVIYSHGLTPLVEGLNWNLHQLRAAISIRYALPPLPPPPPPKSSEPIVATVAAFTTDVSGAEVPLVQIKVEEFVSRQMYPLLPYVFFDYNSSVMPARYHRLSQDEAITFTESKFFNADAMRVYYDVLNIIGKRLQQYPKTKITITGCNDNTSTGEMGNLSLSKSRAEEVRQYLRRTFAIDSNRMEVRERNLSEKPTMSKDSAGIEENRRVEIYSTSWEILQPTLVYDTLLVPSAPVIRFKTTAKSDAGIAKTTLRAFQGDRTLKQYSSLNALDPIVEWNTAREQSTIPRSEEKMKFSYEVLDADGRSAMPLDSIPVEQVTIRKKRSLRIKDKEIDTYRLILFDFDSPEVGPENAKIIKDLVLANIKPQSTVQVTGFTDKLGSAEVNQRLSEGRARSVANLVPSKQTAAKGFGAKMTIYPNELPEGRFLSRTVEVRVETPIEQ
ncbi:MAG: OmpA family protein [Candidatus Kapaibacterium sp.]|nr:MAG: OmpA family protein [Candidatus Kapabacteria bacterium]